jgi:Fe-S-cluster containining protein
VLSFHADYGCRQRGTCCKAGWPIPVEASLVAPLTEAIASGRLTPRVASACFESPPGAPGDTPVLLTRPGGRCVFFDEDPSRCRVHASVGHLALPMACRQFPRITVRDPRGASVTLSHYCPTAAGLLAADLPVTIVDGAPAFPAGGEYVGLDAREALPPLLRPDMAMDWESFEELERTGVDLLANSSGPVEAALGTLRGVIEDIRTWKPDDGRLMDRIGSALADAPALHRPLDVDRLLATLATAVPDALARELPSPRRIATSEGVHRRFLAAHAFANWTAYLGLDLRAWMRSIETAHALLASGHSVGDADLLLRHLADPHALARLWSEDYFAPMNG